MIGAPGTRKGPKEPTRHVGLDAISAVSVARPLRAVLTLGAAHGRGSIATCPPNSAATAGLSTAASTAVGESRRHDGPPGDRVSRRRSPGRRIERADAGRRSRQDQPAADQLRRGDDVGVGDPPGHVAVRLDRERLELGLDQDVPEPRRAEDRDQRRRRAMGPAQHAGARLEAVRRGSRTSTTSRPAVSQRMRRRLVEDRRGEADRPGARRAVDPQLRPAQRVRGRRTTERPEVDRGCRRPRTGRRPPRPVRCRPSASGRAGRPDRTTRRGRGSVGGSPGADARQPTAPLDRRLGWSSAIGATVRVRRAIRSVAGRDREDRGRQSRPRPRPIW